MTREEKQKAIDALKISAPIMAVTQEEFNTYIQTLNKVMDWLEQESILDKIRAEIAYIYCGQYCENPLTADAVREMALEIIDKYMAEGSAE